MKDFDAIFKTYLGKTRAKIGLKKEFGSKFIDIEKGYEKNHDWYYERIFFSKLLSLKKLNDYLKTRKFSSVLEIGCSTGLLPKHMYEIFNNVKYTGMDLSEKSLEIAKVNFKQGQFIKGDFIKSDLKNSYDLIIALDVIDHVYDPDAFLEKIIQKSNKFGYIRSYRGYFEDLTDHKMEYRADEGIYYNNLSIKKIKNTFEKHGIKNFQLMKTRERDRNFYDSDLGRKWKRSSDKERILMLEFTGFTDKDFKKIPVGSELSYELIEKSKNKITAEFLGLSAIYENRDVQRHHTGNTDKEKAVDLSITFEKNEC